MVKHLFCFSGGEGSAIAAIEGVRKYGKENCVLINHECKTEDEDVARFEKQVAEYLELPITYVNVDWLNPDGSLPDQFDVVMKVGAFSSPKGDYLCTTKLKTEPFYKYLADHYPQALSLFSAPQEVVIYYGFDITETSRIQRRSSILGAMGFKTDYPLIWKERSINSTREIGIEPPLLYAYFKHANCIGCLKASLLHWYVTYCMRFDLYQRGMMAEEYIDFTIHTIIRNKIQRPVKLADLMPILCRSLSR